MTSRSHHQSNVIRDKHNIFTLNRVHLEEQYRNSVHTIDQEEESSSFIGYSSGNQSLSSSGWSVQQDSTWGLKKEQTTESQNIYKVMTN